MNTQHRHTCPAMTNPFDTLGPTNKRGELPRCASDSSSMLNNLKDDEQLRSLHCSRIWPGECDQLIKNINRLRRRAQQPPCRVIAISPARTDVIPIISRNRYWTINQLALHY